MYRSLLHMLDLVSARQIIFTGSVLSIFSMAGHGTYAPSKFALRGLADALVMEARLHPDIPIDVHLVSPKSIPTAGYKRENESKPKITLQLEGAETPQDPDTVARLSIEGLETGHYFVTTSFLGDLMRWRAMGNSPRNNWLVDNLMGWLMPFILAYVVWNSKNPLSLPLIIFFFDICQASIAEQVSYPFREFGS